MFIRLLELYLVDISTSTSYIYTCYQCSAEQQLRSTTSTTHKSGVNYFQKEFSENSDTSEERVIKVSMHRLLSFLLSYITYML